MDTQMRDIYLCVCAYAMLPNRSPRPNKSPNWHRPCPSVLCRNRRCYAFWCRIHRLPLPVLGWIEFAVKVPREHVDHRLVGGHHDGCVGDLADQLRAKTSARTKRTHGYGKKKTIVRNQCVPQHKKHKQQTISRRQTIWTKLIPNLFLSL